MFSGKGRTFSQMSLDLFYVFSFLSHNEVSVKTNIKFRFEQVIVPVVFLDITAVGNGQFRRLTPLPIQCFLRGRQPGHLSSTLLSPYTHQA